MIWVIPLGTQRNILWKSPPIWSIDTAAIEFSGFTIYFQLGKFYYSEIPLSSSFSFCLEEIVLVDYLG